MQAKSNGLDADLTVQVRLPPRRSRFDPHSLGFQDDFDDFADRAVSSVRSGDEMSGILDFGGGIGRAGCQADDQKCGQIRKVVSHVADLPG